MPPPGGCSWCCAVPRVLFCGATVGCGLLCAARGVLLRRAVPLSRCLAVWCARLLCRWPSPVGVGHALSVGVARCSASPCCFVRSFVVCGAVVFCRVLWCFPCCCVVSWLFFLCLLGSAHLRFCAALCCTPPPPPRFVCHAFCRFAAAVCWLVLPFVVPCCCLLCCVVRGAACRVVLCRVLLCSAGSVVLCCVSSCVCALLRALPCSVVLCPVVVRCAVRWGAAFWCCCGLLCAVWCPLALCGQLRAVVRCCLLLCAVLRLWAWCLVALCCAVLVVVCCFVLVALLCAVMCLLVLCWAVSRRVVLCGAVLLCTALWGWHCAALSRGLWCRFLLWRALVCCAVPRVLCALLRDVLCCCVLCCAWGCGVLVRCVVVSASCLAVRSGSVFLCGVLCLLVLWCCALRLVVSCGVVLLHAVLFASCCAVFARTVWCCCVMCPALGCCAALWGAVPFGAVLCCVAPCCARCTVCVLPLCCGVCCFCCCPLCCSRPVVLPPCIFKTSKNCFLFSKTEKIVSGWFALCTLSSLHATIPHTEKTSLLYLLNGWPWAGVHRRSPS